MFVSLDKLSTEPFKNISAEQSCATAASGENEKPDPHPMETRHKAKEQSEIEAPFEKCKFRIGDQVIVRDFKGKAVHGRVVWAGKNTGAMELECMYVGIETVRHYLYKCIISIHCT